MAIDQRVVRHLREEVADLLARQRREDAVTGVPPMTAEDERQYARAVIGRVLDLHARSELSLGNTPPNPEEETELAEGIHAALFGVGRLQPLLDDPMVENIDINGCDHVFVQYADGREVAMPPVAESDDELIELVQLLGAYSGLSSRSFDAANPQLDLRLQCLGRDLEAALLHGVAFLGLREAIQGAIDNTHPTSAKLIQQLITRGDLRRCNSASHNEPISFRSHLTKWAEQHFCQVH